MTEQRAGGSQRRTLATWLFIACGAWLVGLGAYFIFVRPALLPEDFRYAGTSAAVLQAAAPRLAGWLSLVFKVMGGFIAGAGVLVTYLAWQVAPERPAGMSTALALVGVLTVGLMSAVNFALGSDFMWLLAVPPLVWAAAVALHARGRLR